MAAAATPFPWASVDPNKLSGSNPATLYNLVGGKWVSTKKYMDIIDPMNGEPFLRMPLTQGEELEAFVQSLKACPKSGLHNMYKKPERYNMWGAISARMAAELEKPEVSDYFARCIQRVCPKSFVQSKGECNIVRVFLHNFSGDSVRFMARGFMVSGDHLGQRSNGIRWPFGPVVVISPFNFPLEIPVLQIMGALYMGNKVLLKCASTTSFVMEEWVRFMHYCGAPKEDLDLIHCSGRDISEVIKMAKPRVVQFTGSSGVAEELALLTHGKVRVEDAGFDWKILGPDCKYVDYVAWQCDQDAYAASGQKCSAESILFVHENWTHCGFYEKLRDLAARRNLADLTVGPVLSHTTEGILSHAKKLLAIPGARVLFGAKELAGHTIPKCYGAVEPTAIFVPLKEMMKPENFGICTTEIFAPFQVITEYKADELNIVLEACERMENHLTAAVVSSDPEFCARVLGSTVNGTTYCGIRARTTGAPQNHWFGPAGDPRGAGIGTIESIRLVWSCHREVIEDMGPLPENWSTPKAS